MSWTDYPTGRQLHKIAIFANILGIVQPVEEGIKTRAEARDIFLDLRDRVNAKRRSAKNVSR